MTTRPKVLLLGNGIARTYYKGANWDKVLEKIRIDGHFDLPSEKYQMPMPLKADMFARNNLDKFLELLDINLPHDKEHNFFTQLLKLDFDYILTTNYTYEAECAILGAPFIFYQNINHYLDGKDCKIIFKDISVPCDIRKKIDEKQKVEDLITTFNAEKDKKIWHIHGEAAYPHSMVLGYSAYAKLLHSYIKHIDHIDPLEINNHGEETWLDKFLEGDVYILGFGMDFAEIDLWWLLQYKSKFGKKTEGKKPDTLYFNPQPFIPDSSETQQYIQGTSEWCKLKMLRACGVKIIDIKFNNILDDGSKSYKKFYELAKDKIEEHFEKRKQEL